MPQKHVGAIPWRFKSSLRHHGRKGRRCCIRCCLHNRGDHCTLLRAWRRGDAPPCSQFQQVGGVTYASCVSCVGSCVCVRVVKLADVAV